ncbi:MAG: hypothetical protein R3200_08430 [Xanthomonadales bacterium]|nr:hypothetical protein [Xanthomonadales bacterium]
MNRYSPRRRQILAGMITGGLLPWQDLLAAGELLPVTPSDAEGPFFPVTIPEDHDADLVQVAGQEERSPGRIAHVQGNVTDPTGTPIDGARVEIWQCDASGTYHHPGDRGTPDRRFQGYGQSLTGSDGGYRFRTIRPVPYGGRTPHIHFRVTAPGFDRLTTQLYVAEEAERNSRDGLYKRHSQAHRMLLTRSFQPSGSPQDPVSATFNIVLG